MMITHPSIQEGCSESEKKSHVLRCAHDYDDCLLLRRKQRRKMYIVATSAAAAAAAAFVSRDQQNIIEIMSVSSLLNKCASFGIRYFHFSLLCISSYPSLQLLMLSVLKLFHYDFFFDDQYQF